MLDGRHSYLLMPIQTNANMDELKFIVTELNKIFDTDYNMISFDSLPVTELLQVVVNVLAMVNAIAQLDVSKNSDQAIMDILTALQTIKYVPKKEVDATEFRQGLIVGKRNIIHPILYWLLSNADKVQKRVYFANFVQKVDIPPEILADPEMEQINMHYEKLIEDFWTSYNENKKEQKNADESTELQKDTKKMATEISNLSQRLEMQDDKLKNIPNRESLMTSVKGYRREEKQEEKLQNQLKEHKNILSQLASDIKTLQSTLSQMALRRPQNLDPVQQISEEVDINKILAETQLPRENQDAVSELQAFERVAVEPEPTQEELDDININMEEINQAVQTLLNKKIALTNTNDDQLLPFRNQALMIANKKQELSTFIMKIKSKNDEIIELINQKAITLREIVGGDILHGEELKVFIANLRDRSVIYKKYRAYMQGIQSELGIVSRTLEILKIGDSSIESAIKAKRENPPVESDSLQLDDVAELKQKCKTLYQQANAKRSDSMRIYEEMTRLRSNFGTFTDIFDENKREFDNATGNLTDQLIKIEKNAEDVEEDIKKSEQEWKNISKDIENFEMIAKKYNDNMTSASGMMKVLQQLGDSLKEKERTKMELESKHAFVAQQKDVEQDELEQLKRIKQMVLYKIQG